MREAVVDAKVAVAEVKEAIARTEREVGAERQRLADAERRGRLAGEIQDQETVTVADRFAAKHRERLGVLERKLATQREELALAQRELDEMQTQLKAADQASGAGSTEQAWRDLEEAGGTIRCESNASLPGTCFRILLPAVSAAEVEAVT